ncbi:MULTISPECIES: peptide chain release factor 2 [Thalassospira]|uniref:Peptide chain release factor 2 n=1 Tax=Thalassospira povalilytica TaxID=732237 RepID=A0A8I1MCM2_9PROT|nr:MULTISPECIES: peptide chain release factor 2 [Thalassospira]MEE3043994.1 peptide chain release factor 2 [Pseudomonadota bacterium]MAL39251.1 peptide chain release factor 2 [Thalassospira sp.]MBN8198784.1 peptide chain release factor 2 [Thalassospira povalilytica]MCC4242570.1 peptide chain release factor 2 [Thalassospira povalilytica]URK19117.1 peptide chain release factor 2 [Thalassospira sp. GO-4]
MRAEAQALVDEIKQSMALLRRHLDWDNALRRLDELNALAEDPTLWDNAANAQKVMRERTQLDDAINGYKKLAQELEDNIELIELGEAEGDAETVAEAEEGLRAIREIASQRELESLLSGEADANDAYLEIHAGAGGTEAQDWASMMARMYYRWAESKGYKLEMLEESAGEEAGIKSVTYKITGHNAYGWLKNEVGVHRLVRISPYDSSARRHTSFSSVWVYPVIDDDINIEILDKDLRVDTYRASGAGGQHVNRTDSAVRITHIPTGIVAQCQNDRSQHKNRDTAMKMLKARLYEAELQKREAEAQAVEDSKTDIGWGHQIRSYVLQPYQMIKDLRTGTETSDTQGVLNGDLDAFMAAALAAKVTGSAGEIEDID